jgi:acetylglutamate kinase
MRVLIKLGGALLDTPESRTRLTAEIAAALTPGVQGVIVHGGGRQMTGFLAERGIESEFVNGLRVTTPAVMDAVLKVLAGSVNHELVSSFVAAGALAVGLSGIDAALTEAEVLDPKLGSVGRVVRCNPKLLNLLTDNGYLPVVACVAGDRAGRRYNVNADQMAVACAIAFQVDRLFFLTDVDGVRGVEGKPLSTLTSEEIDELIEAGIATGGMRAKLEAGKAALAGGAGEVVIAPGATPGVIAKLMAGGAIGTRLVRKGVSS